MKKFILAFGLLVLIYAMRAMADPTMIAVRFVCPTAAGVGAHTLSRSIGQISGYGTETLNDKPVQNSPLFNFDISFGDIYPVSLHSYSNSGTSFDFSTGIVSCRYQSSSVFKSFTTTYHMTNVAGGQIAAQTLNSITINQFVGLKK